MVLMEAELNALDRGCGDGDCGSTMAYGAKGTMRSRIRDIRDYMHSFETTNVFSCHRRYGLLRLALALRIPGADGARTRLDGLVTF